MNINRYAALARPLDLNYSSNLAIVLISLILLLLGTIYHFFLGKDFPDSTGWGFQLGLAAFLTWMIARETDPDHVASAFLAIPFSVAAFYHFSDLSILPLLGVVLMLRMVNQITGKHARWIESLGMLGLIAYLVWKGNPMVGLGISVAFLADSRLPDPHPRHFWWGCMALLLTLTLFVFSPAPAPAHCPSAVWVIGVFVNCLLFSFVIRHYRHPESTQDYSHQPANGRRMQASQGLALATMLAHFFYQGEPGWIGTAPFWSAMVAANLVQIYRWMTGH